MKFNNIIESIKNMNGNYFQKTGSLYILPANIERLPEMINCCDDFQSILITPFLVNTVKDTVYELHYYEFEIEVSNTLNSFYIEYPQGNVLPKEIVENIKPKAIAAKEDVSFFVNALNSYFAAMSKMTFESDKLLIKDLHGANLYFQIY